MDPVRLISVDQITNSEGVKEYKLVYDYKTVEKWFKTYKNCLIAPVCVAGKYRSGKSFLCNQILSRMDGFKVGSTTNACTDGVWIYPMPERKTITRDDEQKDLCVFVLDSEGCDSPNRDAKLDQKLTCFNILISSAFVWNAWKIIDENDVLNLAALMKLTEKIVKANKKEGLRVKDCFPKFYWILRDFNQNLNYDDGNSYMEKALMEREGNENTSKNSARAFIKRNLKNRACFTLPRPLDEESELVKMTEMKPEQLRQEYTESFQKFRNKLMKDIQPKKWDNKELDCITFLSFVEEIVKYLNEGDLVTNTLASVSDYMFDYKISQISDNVINEFQNHFIAKIEEQLPMDTESMFTNFFREQNDSLRKFFNLAKNYLSVNSMSKQYDLLLSNMQSSIGWVEKENEVKSLEKANSYLKNFDSKYLLPVLQNKESFTLELFNSIKSDYATFVKNYNENCKGPLSKERGLDFLIEHIFVKLGVLYETMIKSVDNVIEEKDLQLVESLKYEKRQKGMIEDQEEQIKQYRTEKVSHNLQIEKLQTENESLQRVKEHDKSAYEERILSLESKLDNKIVLNLEMQNKLSTLENNLAEKTDTLKQKDFEIENLNARQDKKDKIIQEFELKLVNRGATNSDSESFEVLRNLTRELEKLQHETRQQHQAKMKKLYEKLQTKEDEKTEMLNTFEERLKTMREEYKNALNKMRLGMNKTIEELKSKVSCQATQIRTSQAENLRMLDQEQQLIKTNYQYDTLKAEFDILQNRLVANDTKSKLTLDSLNKFVNDIERKNKVILEIEEERNSLKMIKYKFESEMEDIVNFLIYLSTKKHEQNQVMFFAKKIDPSTLKKLSSVFDKLKLKQNIQYKV